MRKVGARSALGGTPSVPDAPEWERLFQESNASKLAADGSLSAAPAVAVTSMFQALAARADRLNGLPQSN